MTNVEGVLDRIAQAIKLAIKDGDGTETENGRVLLEKIDSIKAGGLPVTMILQDPMGNSVLVFGQGQKNCVCAGRAGCVRGLKGPEFF